MLQLLDIHVSLNETEIVHGVSCSIAPGELVVLMGPNGSGKSTLANAIMGSPTYQLNPPSKIILDEVDITEAKTEEKARAGLFLGFQNPVPIPGVSVVKLLREVQKDITIKKIREVATQLHCDDSLLLRGMHDGFSGGEKKKLEMLQALLLANRYALFDEIDTGLDVDALKIVASGIISLKKKGIGCMVITHYQRLISLLPVDRVLVMREGNIIAQGAQDLSEKIEKEGYENLT